ncbi:uncharacterized protein A1O9_09036 [Exophiala aquamarina CBS 119918]|uniref:Uncharacterized protein n=1 Tax=Exophiala aquamarina CBS 119918 TaxID=1182545 RepID=A0A072P389_9EURO|nr:uncharacterized protein A1O9_09036 [Exophiala aquamarina CBS 119918]KEF54594.1 hypothetical protein A1O9_09036 [Exophiala aquamarina CBS 119918]
MSLSSHAAYAKMRNPCATNACCSRAPTIPRKIARVWSPSTRTAWPPMDLRYNELPPPPSPARAMSASERVYWGNAEIVNREKLLESACTMRRIPSARG